MKVGKLVSVNYNQLKVKIASEIRGGSVNIAGHVYYFGNIGSYLKLDNAIGETVVCEVVSIFDTDQGLERSSFDLESKRELILKPIGTISERCDFSMGVGIYPSLYSDVSIVTHEDMKLILRNNEDNKTGETASGDNKIHRTFSLGISKNLINYPIDVGVDNFFNIHSAVLGNSGSGKSNTIAHIVQEIHRKQSYSASGSRILIFDVNGEYKEAFNDKQNEDLSIKCYKPNLKKEEEGLEPFYLPHFLLNLDEWSAFLMAKEGAQKPFWDKVLQESYRFYKISSSSENERNKFINYFRYRICSLLSDLLGRADTDTAIITTASGLLGSLLNIISSDEGLHEHLTELKADISSLRSACVLDFGQNKNQLSTALKSVSDKVDDDLLLEVLNTGKIKYGDYYDQNFLKISAELVLLEEDARGNGQIRGYTATMMTRLNHFLENTDCDFMRESTEIKSKDAFLRQLWGEDDDMNHLVIVDTSELSPDILETLTSVISRLLFDDRKVLKHNERRKKPIHLILDEAHRYIRTDREYLIKENIFEKIAREGRKYAYFLTISSQRPSELSETVLSQCGNFIIHRIQNERDMNYIKAILPYFSEDFSNKIKQSIPGEALVFGNCVSMPLHLKITQANPEPNSKNCKISEEWFRNPEAFDGEDLLQ
jgi:hypothetical protein